MAYDDVFYYKVPEHVVTMGTTVHCQLIPFNIESNFQVRGHSLKVSGLRGCKDIDTEGGAADNSSMAATANSDRQRHQLPSRAELPSTRV